MSPTLEAGQRPRMDPRIARRRVEVRREEGRRRLRILVWLSALAAALLLAVGSLWTPLFQVHHVAVSIASPASQPVGVPSLTDTQVVTAAGLAHRRLMIDVDGAKVARRLDALPLLGAARVSVDWPGTVKISVAERLPVVAVAVPAGQGSTPRWALLDATGRVLAVDAAAPPGLPVLYGVPVVPPAGAWVPGSAGPAAPVPSSPAESAQPGPASAGPATTTASRSLVDMNAASDSPAVPRDIAAALAVAAALPPQIRGDVRSITIGRLAGAGTPSAGAGTPSAAAGGRPAGSPAGHSGGPAGDSKLTMSVQPARVASGTITVVLGDGSQLAAKLTALETLLLQANLSGVTEIDLTVPDRPAALTAR